MIEKPRFKKFNGTEISDYTERTVQTCFGDTIKTAQNVEFDEIGTEIYFNDFFSFFFFGYLTHIFGSVDN